MGVHAIDYSNVVPFGRKHNNKIAGKDSEVYAFRTKEEISLMISVFNRRIEEAENDNQRHIARRNKLLFIIGINVGIRGSDLRELKWSFFFDNQNRFKESYKFIPIKQRKHKKFVKISFNDAVKRAVYDYVTEYPVNNLNDYLFPSRKGSTPITVDRLRRIVKDAADEAGIKQNVGSHSLRKTFGRHIYLNAKDKTSALILLQTIFSHSSSATTLRYIGIKDDDVKDAFDNLNLGLDMI